MAFTVCALSHGVAPSGTVHWSSTHSLYILDYLLNKALKVFQNSQKRKILLWKVKPKRKRLFYHPSPIRTYFSKLASPHALHQGMDIPKQRDNPVISFLHWGIQFLQPESIITLDVNFISKFSLSDSAPLLEY